MSDAVIDIDNITKHYVMGEETVHALRGVSVQIRRNEYLAIMGPSGSGKSTLMNMLGCLDTPSSGRYFFNGKDVSAMDDDELAAIRNHEIGFVFQTFNLLPRSTSLRNVELPLIYAGLDPEMREEKAANALREVGLGDRMHHKPNELSGGQRQRVAIARAMVLEPELLICDEPVSALDAANRIQMLDLIQHLRDARGIGVLFISHDLGSVAGITDRVAVLYRGRIVEQGPTAALLTAPQHPYTRLLIGSAPTLTGGAADRTRRTELREQLAAIETA
ncbi:MAG: putative transport system ATP-binding protein [Verrucomicrobiota bacterium]